MTDENGTVTDKYSYDAWGNVTHTYGSTSDNPYQFVGQLGYYTHYEEPTLNLLQLGVRYYDAGLGRFTQRDKVGSHNWSSYIYALNRPNLKIDPLGLYPQAHAWKSCRNQITNIKDIIDWINNKASDVDIWQLLPAWPQYTGQIGVQCWKGYCPHQNRPCGFAHLVSGYVEVSFKKECPPLACLILHEMVHVVSGRLGHNVNEWGYVKIKECEQSCPPDGYLARLGRKGDAARD